MNMRVEWNGNGMEGEEMEWNGGYVWLGRPHLFSQSKWQQTYPCIHTIV